MNHDKQQSSHGAFSYFTFNRASQQSLVRHIRTIRPRNTDTTLAFPAIDVISYCCALDAARQELIDNPQAFEEALNKSNLKKLRLLIAADYFVHKTDGSGNTPYQKVMLEACKSGNLPRVKMLVAAGAPLNHANRLDWTPLIEAALSHKIEVVDFLLRHSASVNYPTTMIPLHWILLANHPDESLKIIAGKPAEMTYFVNHFKTWDNLVKHLWNSYHTRKKIIKLLLQYNPSSLSVQNKDGYTPFHYAAFRNHQELMGLMISETFFPPTQTLLKPAHNATLQEHCLCVVLNNLACYDKQSLKEHIIPYIAYQLDMRPTTTNILDILVNKTSLDFQRKLMKCWKRNASQNNEKMQLFLEAHVDRHLTHIQDIMFIKDSYNATARDRAVSAGHAAMIVFLDRIMVARKPSELDPKLHHAIKNTLAEKLTISR